MSAVLRAEGLCLRRRGRTVLDAVSLTLSPGEFVALIGANGSGKTTLLQVLLGMLRPERGTVSWFGHRLGSRHASTSIGYLPQSASAETRIPLRVRDVVAFGRLSSGCSKRLRTDDQSMIEHALDIMGLLPLASRPVRALSGGESRRMHLARVLCQNARVLLLDEPTAHLDLGGQLDLLDRIAQLHAEQGLAVLLTLHDLTALPPSCRRAVVLDAGCCVYDGPFQGIAHPDVLRHLYGDRASRVLATLQATTGTPWGRA